MQRQLKWWLFECKYNEMIMVFTAMLLRLSVRERIEIVLIWGIIPSSISSLKSTSTNFTLFFMAYFHLHLNMLCFLRINLNLFPISCLIVEWTEVIDIYCECDELIKGHGSVVKINGTLEEVEICCCRLGPLNVFWVDIRTVLDFVHFEFVLLVTSVVTAVIVDDYRSEFYLVD